MPLLKTPIGGQHDVKAGSLRRMENLIGVIKMVAANAFERVIEQVERWHGTAAVHGVLDRVARGAPRRNLRSGNLGGSAIGVNGISIRAQTGDVSRQSG